MHVKKSTLEKATKDGTAVEPPYWDPRLAFAPDHAVAVLPWAAGLQARRTAPIEALSLSVKADRAEIAADVWGSKPPPYLRINDDLVVVDKRRKLADDSVWRVMDIDVEVMPSQRYTRRNLHFECRRVGRIKDPVNLLGDLYADPS